MEEKKVYRISGPDGRVHNVTGPINARPDHLKKYVFDTFYTSSGETQTIEDESGSSISAPIGMNREEVLFKDKVENKQEDPAGFFGHVKTGVDYAMEPIRAINALKSGAEATLSSSITTLRAGGRQRTADFVTEAIKDEDYSLLDYIPHNPFTDRDNLRASVAWTKLLNADADFSKSEKRMTRLSRSADRMRQKNAEFIQRAYPKPDGYKGVVYDIGGVGTTVAASVGLSLLTKNPAAATVLFSELQRSSVYLEAKDAGLDIRDADRLSTIAGLAEGALEFYGLNKIIKFGQVDEGLKLVAKRAASEALQEGSQTGVEELITQASGIREVDVKRAVEDVAYSMFLGAVAGGGTASVIEVGKELALEKGLNPRIAEALSVRVEENKQEFSDRIADVFEQETQQTFQNKRVNRQVEKIMNRFLSGENINVLDELQGIEHINEAEKKAVVDLIDQEKGNQAQMEQKALSARVDKIDNDISNIEKRISLVADAINIRAAEGQPTKKLDNQIEKLIAEKELLEEERYDLHISGVSGLSKDSDKVLVQSKVLDQEKYISKEKKRAFNIGFRTGVKLAKKNVVEARKVLISAVEQSGIPKGQAEGVYKKISKITTPEQAAKALPKLNAEITTIIERSQRKQLTSTLKKLLKGASSKGAAKPTGKLANPDDQFVVDKMNQYIKMSKSAANEELREIASIDPENITEYDILKMKVLAVAADPSKVSVDNLIDVLDETSAFISGSRSEAQIRRRERRESIQMAKDTIEDSIMFGRDPDSLHELKASDVLFKKLREVGSLENDWSNGWGDTLDIILGKTAEGRRLRDRFEIDVHAAVQRSKGLSIQWGNEFMENAANIFGLSKKKLRKKLLKDEKRASQGKFARDGQPELEEGQVAPEGKKPELWVISRAEMRKLWMELQDETLRPSLISPEGNGVTQDMEMHIEETLTEQDKEFAISQFTLYKKMFPEINKIYGELYGAHLPENEFYSPVRAVHDDEKTVVDEFLQELSYRATGSPTFTKSRVKGIRKIREQSDVSAMMRQITQASHFISMAQTTRDIKTTFSDAETRDIIKGVYGDQMMGTIDSYIEDFERGYSKRAEGIMNTFNWLNSNFSVAALALKPNLMFKQLTSFVTFAGEVPTTHYLDGLRDFITNPQRAMDIMMKSELMMARGSNQDVEIARDVQRNSKKLLKGNVADIMLLPVRMGDRGAIYFGGWTVYRYHKEVLGKSHEEAMRQFELSVAKSQQSSDIDQKSRAQRSTNVLVRNVTMFSSAPNAYYRAIKRANRRFSRGEITAAEYSKKMAIYTIIIPTLFQYATDAFDWGDEDDDNLVPFLPKNIERAILTSPTDGIFVVGPIIERLYAANQGIYYPSSSPNYISGFEQMLEATTKLFDQDEDAIEAFVELIIGMGQVTGIPVKTGINIVGGLEDIAEGDTEVGVKRVLGYTERVAERSSD